MTPRQQGGDSAAVRVIAALIAVALVPAVWGLLVLFLFGGLFNAAVPNPAIPDGDPCCGYPDTWSEVREGFIYALATGFATVMVVRVAYVLARGAASSSGAPPVRWGCAAAVGVALPTLAFGVTLGISSASRQPTNCSTFDFDAGRFQSADRDVRRWQAYGLSDCGMPGHDDLTAPVVRALLGDPQRTGPGGNEDITVWHYPDLEVEFMDGQVVGQRIYPYEDSPWG